MKRNDSLSFRKMAVFWTFHSDDVYLRWPQPRTMNYLLYSNCCLVSESDVNLWEILRKIWVLGTVGVDRSTKSFIWPRKFEPQIAIYKSCKMKFNFLNIFWNTNISEFIKTFEIKFIPISIFEKKYFRFFLFMGFFFLWVFSLAFADEGSMRT